MTVLLVEDDVDRVGELADFLRRASLEVVTASSMPEAVALLSSQHFDVIVSDYHIGEAGSGAELLAWVAEHHRDMGRVIWSATLLPDDVAAHAIVDKTAPATLERVVRALAGVARPHQPLG